MCALDIHVVLMVNWWPTPYISLDLLVNQEGISFNLFCAKCSRQTNNKLNCYFDNLPAFTLPKFPMDSVSRSPSLDLSDLSIQSQENNNSNTTVQSCCVYTPFVNHFFSLWILIHHFIDSLHQIVSKQVEKIRPKNGANLQNTREYNMENFPQSNPTCNKSVLVHPLCAVYTP